MAPGLPGFTVEILREIDSTNTELMRRARAGRDEPVLLVAERQTAGRGRLGRDWHSDVGASLTFSLGLPLAPADWSGLSLAVGLAVAESLHPDLLLKWPNDVWLADRKLAGILVETAGFAGDATASRYVVSGVGINIAPRAADGLSTAPAALGEVWPEADAGAALGRVAVPLVKAVRAFERSGFAPLVDRFAARDLLRGRAVALSDGTEGIAQGVDGRGALLVHTAAGLHTVSSSEVSVRPRA